MKKIILLMVSVIMLFAFTACGGGGSADGGGDEKVIYAGWFSADLPEGFVPRDEKEGDFETEANDYELLKFMIDSGLSAESDMQIYIDEDTVQTDDVVIGDVTWHVLEFTWNDLPSAMYFAEFPDKDVTVQIDTFCIAPRHEKIMTMLETFELVDAPYDSWQEFLKELYESE